MKSLLILAILAAAPTLALGQLDVSQLLVEGGKKAFAGLAPLSEKEQKEVLNALQPYLARRITFRQDGTASSSHHLRGSATHIEWKGLKINRITKDSLTDADKANHVVRRYRVAFTSQGHRKWDKNTNRWSKWWATGYPLFPSGIAVEEINGALIVRAQELGDFRPGPIHSTGSDAQIIPSRPTGLPSGMERAGK